MNEKQLERMKNGKGFISALDQSGGSTPKALAQYGIEQDAYKSDEEMFTLVHQMRTRVIKSPSYTSEHILGAILFENTMDRTIDGMPTADYLWEKKGVVPFLKVDKGLADMKDGVQLMKPMPQLDALLEKAKKNHIFGTKMRSVIKEYNAKGIKEIVAQQFELAKKICSYDLVPIIEPEVDIHCVEKAKCEELLKEEIFAHLKKTDKNAKLMFKVTIPTVPGFYSDLMRAPQTVRVVALSGGYPREEADELLKKNPGMIASFSRAFLSGLTAQQSEAEFDATMKETIKEVYEASVNKD